MRANGEAPQIAKGDNALDVILVQDADPRAIIRRQASALTETKRPARKIFPISRIPLTQGRSTERRRTGQHSAGDEESSEQSAASRQRRPRPETAETGKCTVQAGSDTFYLIVYLRALRTSTPPVLRRTRRTLHL